ncbi:Haloacetate dehalogenase H-1 [Nocardia otitidiscaviarum]|uniref:Haloacetate dehalogenase H-1 n=1 Tax=Nocardia otitidiscaviarum TaxID=1823 RepID=A0A378YUM8_9NOCA|nr:alpha/beta fold hydrolase [Nocardia otitidiscaviarum]SUA80473.1 Haloacetate dehalogenase H-1 [Nocardia otitidiscaviarum]
MSTAADPSARDQDDSPRRITAFHRDGLTFPVTDSGPLDGAPVLLLHGWPQDSRSWDAVAAALNRHGYRTFSPNMRGASPTAAPRWRWSYRLDELARDVLTMADAIGRPVHVVGHDWGAAAAWAAATDGQHRMRSLTALSVPHPTAFLRAMLTSRQALASWYMYVFQLPLLPELMVRTPLFRRMLERTGQPADVARRDGNRLRDRTIARGGLHWYRGMPFSAPGRLRARVTIPTLQIWSDGDTAVLATGPKLSSRYVDGPFRFEVLPGVSHWIPDEAPETVTRLLVEHFEANRSGDDAP